MTARSRSAAVIERAGGRHGERQGAAADRLWLAYLRSLGCEVLDFWNPAVTLLPPDGYTSGTRRSLTRGAGES